MIVRVFLVPESWSRWPMLYLKLNVLSCLGGFWRLTCSEMDKVESRGPVQLLFRVLPVGLSSAWWRIGSLRNMTLLSLLASFKSSANCNTRRSQSMLVRRANYWAAIWHRTLQPGSSIPAPHGYAWPCKPECGDDPASHSSVEIQWMTCPAAPQASFDLITCGCTSGCSTQCCRCGKGHFDWSEACRCTNCENQPHQSTSKFVARDGQAIDAIMVMNINLIWHCVVLLQLECWKESAHHSCISARSVHVLQHSTIHLSIRT